MDPLDFKRRYNHPTLVILSGICVLNRSRVIFYRGGLSTKKRLTWGLWQAMDKRAIFTLEVSRRRYWKILRYRWRRLP